MPPYRKRPMVVDAVRNETGQPIMVDTLHGTVECKPGDWIVTGPADSWPVEAGEFERSYEPNGPVVCRACGEPAIGADVYSVATTGLCRGCLVSA